MAKMAVNTKIRRFLALTPVDQGSGAREGGSSNLGAEPEGVSELEPESR